MTWRSIGGKVLAHVEIMRPYTVSYAGLLAIEGASIGSRRHLDARLALRASVVTMCGWLAGHYVGDYFDRDIDARTKPGRPLPSGRVSAREAVIAMLLLIGGGNLAAMSFGLKTLLLALGTTALGVSYSKVFKARALLGNLDRGVLGVCAVAFGALATRQRPPLRLLSLAAATLCHDTATNLVGTLRDLDGDRAAGCRTVPVVYGLTRATEIAAGSGATAFVLAAATVYSGARTKTSVRLLTAVGVVDLAVYGWLLGRRRQLTRAEALTAHKVLVAERLLLSSALVATRAPGLATTLLALALPLSLALQATMRDRHERVA